MDDVSLENSPGKSFRFALTGETGRWNDAVFFEQEETRVIRTEDSRLPGKRLNSTGEPALYDVKIDLEQNRNVYDDRPTGRSSQIWIQGLRISLMNIPDEKYDLWKGGGAKGSVDRPENSKSSTVRTGLRKQR